MPTVRPGIKPLIVYPAPVGMPERGAFSVFPAQEWEKHGGEPGMYRVMIGEKWLARKGERRSFYDPQGLEAVYARWGMGAMGFNPDEPDPGRVPITAPPGTFVTFMEPETMGNHLGRTNSYPFQDKDGNWFVYLLYPRRGGAVPLDYLVLRDRAGGGE